MQLTTASALSAGPLALQKISLRVAAGDAPYEECEMPVISCLEAEHPMRRMGSSVRVIGNSAGRHSRFLAAGADAVIIKSLDFNQ